MTYIRKIKTRLSNGKIIKGYEVVAGSLKWKTISKLEALKFKRKMSRR